MAIPFATKNRGTELEKRVEALEQEQSNKPARNDNEYFFKHKIVLPVYREAEGDEAFTLTFENAILDTDETYSGVSSAQWLYMMITHIINLGLCHGKLMEPSEEERFKCSILDYDGILTPNGLKEGQRVRIDLLDAEWLAEQGGGPAFPGDPDFGGYIFYIGDSNQGVNLVTDTIVNEGE